MTGIIVALTLLFIGSLTLYFGMKVRLKNKRNPKDIVDWMNMSYKDRLKIDNKHKLKVAERKRLLLQKIRKEYKVISSERRD